LTRTGRPFFGDDGALGRALLDEAARAMEAAGLWDELETDWCCLDAEILPWNAKAQALLKEQYAPVASAGRAALVAELAVAEAGAGRDLAGADALVAALRSRLADIEAYATAYARYCWEVNGLQDLRVAPFHLLAVEGRTLLDHDHHWHLGTLGLLAGASSLFVATPNQEVDTGDPASKEAGARWWQERTGAGGEGMVVKPLDFLPLAGDGRPRRDCQPAVKVRGREYLRIIYGPEYTEPRHLERLRARGLGAKRALAAREFALGVEGLERFVRKEPLRRVHECAFGVLALESEPVDPRL
jgi:protein phosphatase